MLLGTPPNKGGAEKEAITHDRASGFGAASPICIGKALKLQRCSVRKEQTLTKGALEVTKNSLRDFEVSNSWRRQELTQLLGYIANIWLSCSKIQ